MGAVPTPRETRVSGGFRNGGIRVPAWAIGTVLGASAIYGLGVRTGREITDNDSRLARLKERASSLDFRLCRIERALQISPYQSCYPAPDPDPARKP